jgi:hypothetical protein
LGRRANWMIMDSNIRDKSYYQDEGYLEYLENCRDVCQQIFMARNISLNESKIIEQLKRIDKLCASESGHN